jgi:hypothetical protein
MYYVEVDRGQGWTLVGQYSDRESAERIADDYWARGEKCRIVCERRK